MIQSAVRYIIQSFAASHKLIWCSGLPCDNDYQHKATPFNLYKPMLRTSRRCNVSAEIKDQSWCIVAGTDLNRQTMAFVKWFRLTTQSHVHHGIVDKASTRLLMRITIASTIFIQVILSLITRIHLLLSYPYPGHHHNLRQPSCHHF